MRVKGVYMERSQYRISELADKAGVTKRTIHYYMGRGLLPHPDGAGLGTTYSDEHLYRVMLIKKLQDAYLPLDEIKKRISGMCLADIRRNLEEDTLQFKLQEQAVEYNTAGNAGISYERLNVSFGLEIHFPTENVKARKLAEALYKYAEKMMKEG